MISAAELSSDGELDAQLAQLYLNMEQWDKAIAAAQRALDKGELRNPGMSHLVIGMAYFNQKRFNDSLNQLAKAEEYDSSRRMAQQWGRYVQAEKVSYEQLQEEFSS